MTDPSIYDTDRGGVCLIDLAHSLGLETQAGIDALRVAFDCVRVLDSKQKDYGPKNIAAFGEYGVLVRVNDKVQRLINLAQPGKEPAHESVDDSWSDLTNYGLIAQMIRRGLWDREPKTKQKSN